MSKSIVTSPILYATPFVGERQPHKTQEGKMWLSCAEYGFSFCCEEIDEAFGPIQYGEIMQIEIRLDEFPHSTPYSIDKACFISGCAERMLMLLFGYEVGTSEFDRAVVQRHVLLEDGVIDQEKVDGLTAIFSLHGDLPGNLYYCVRRL